MPLVVAEAVLLHDALDKFVNGEVAEEDGPVVDFGFGGADVDAFGCVGKEANKESVIAFIIVLAVGVVIFGKAEGRAKFHGSFFLPGDLLGDGVLARS